METLSRLFGSQTKAKLLKLFVFNPEAEYDINDLVERTKETQNKIRKEIPTLIKMRVIKKRSFSKSVLKKKGKKTIQKKVRVSGWKLNDNFEFIAPLQQFLVKINHLGPKEISKKLGRGGVVKLIILSGVFIQDPESRLDLLVVGDHLKRGLMDGAIHNIEAEMGKELRYSVFETGDFKYRLGMYDKLIHDVLDFPHEVILDKLGISKE